MQYKCESYLEIKGMLIVMGSSTVVNARNKESAYAWR